MRIEKILVPTDFSPFSEQALDYATALARDTGASLILLHVAEPLPLYGDVPYYAVQEPNVTELRQQLDAIHVDPQIRTRRSVVFGMTGEQILEQAAEEQVDLIVMGTHGRTGLSRVLMGSIAEVVVRRASCPVLTLKAMVGATAKA